VFSQTQQSGIEKQKNPPRHSIQERVRQDLGEDLDEEDAIRELFILGDRAVPSLIKFLSDRDKGRKVSAARGLAYVGNQQGMQALRNAVKAEMDEETKSAMSCFLAGGLVETRSKSDLDFLRSTIERAHFVEDDEKDFQAFCAALALGMRGETIHLRYYAKSLKRISSIQMKLEKRFSGWRASPRRNKRRRSSH